jgi:hypothetical protein
VTKGGRCHAGDSAVYCVHRRAGSVRTKRRESMVVVELRSRLDPRYRGAEDYLIAAPLVLALMAMTMEWRASEFRDGSHGAAAPGSAHLGWVNESRGKARM